MVVVLVATWAYSGSVGSKVDERIQQAQHQRRLLESQADPELQQFIGEAQAAQVLLAEMEDANAPDWLAALRYFKDRPFQVTREQTNDEVAVTCAPDDVVELPP